MGSSSGGLDDCEQNKLYIDSSDDIDSRMMAELPGRGRQEGAQGGAFSPGRPLSMKLFASWEVEANSSNCIPRWVFVKMKLEC